MPTISTVDYHTGDSARAPVIPVQGGPSTKKCRWGLRLFDKDAFKDRKVKVKAHLGLIFGITLVADLTIYLVLAATGRARGDMFNIMSILLILVLLGAFCHSIIRMLMLLQRPKVRTRRKRHIRPRRIVVGVRAEITRCESGDEVVPEKPIPVVMAIDEEEPEELDLEDSRPSLRPPPPTYGNIRSSFRMNPAYVYRVEIPPSPLTPTYDEAMKAAECAVGLQPPDYVGDSRMLRKEDQQVNKDMDERDIHPSQWGDQACFVLPGDTILCPPAHACARIGMETTEAALPSLQI